MLYENIKKACEEKGISIYRLEQLAGLSKSAISKWSTCSPNINNLKAVADILGVKVDDLL